MEEEVGENLSIMKKVMGMSRFVYVLKKEDKYWYKILESELKEWMEDGSLDEGDLVVYPDKVMKIEGNWVYDEEIRLVEV